MAESGGPVPRRGYATPAGLESPVLYDSGAPAAARSGPGPDPRSRGAVERMDPLTRVVDTNCT